MQYYRYEGKPTNPDIPNNYRDYEFANAISAKAEPFNESLKGKAYVFVSGLRPTSCLIGIIVKNDFNIEQMIKRFLKAIEIDVSNASLTEITFNGIDHMLKNADRADYIEDRDSVLERFNLDNLLVSYRTGFDFEEDTLSVCGKETIVDRVSLLLSSKPLLEELDRIFLPRKSNRVKGIPVQYMVITDDDEEREVTITALLQALYANKRIDSKRYTWLKFYPHSSFSSLQFRCLLNSCEGGTVIISFMTSGNDDSDVANGDIEIIENICECARRYTSKVQMIFCFPRECTKSKDMFYANLGETGIVEIKEDVAAYDNSKKFLEILARNAGLRTDKNLFCKLKKDEKYLANDLRIIFAEWYAKKMKTTVYPQYKDIATVKSVIRDQKPNGTAYDELQELIGLAEVKTVIQQALDYYKAQKMFADKGMVIDHPAMHMVFKGNPGTAKTTVARLFAKIMKENNLLSKGHLIECGRADLVGRFVGWTAPTVKQKFKEAEGGVLFIDEAYSLVEERNGLYGDEAINTIVQEMENHREDMVVIFAGYPDKMEEFINKNPGLRSRIAFHVPFEDYDTDSLCRIARLIAKGKGLSLNDEAMSKLAGIFESARSQEDFGNGRYARNIIEQARMAQASRLVKMDYSSVTKEDVSTICPEDIRVPEAVRSIKRFGFCA